MSEAGVSEAGARAVYPGTFDPVTLGHVDIIGRAARLFDSLVVAVAADTGKAPLFSLDERTAMVEQAVAALPDDAGQRIRVRPFDGLLVDLAREERARAIVRGLRAVSDFEFEFQMVGMNTRLDPTLETVFLMASEKHTFIASRFVKEVARLGGDVSSFVAPDIARALRAKYPAGSGGPAG